MKVANPSAAATDARRRGAENFPTPGLPMLHCREFNHFFCERPNGVTHGSLDLPANGRRVEMANEHLVKCDPDYLNVEGLRLRAVVCVNEFGRSKQATAKEKEQARAAISALLGL